MTSVCVCRPVAKNTIPPHSINKQTNKNTTRTKKGRKRSREVGGMSTMSGGMPQTAAAAAAAAGAAAKAKQQAQQAETFYRFQAREQRRSELLELQQKFEEGRRRLAALKVTCRLCVVTLE